MIRLNLCRYVLTFDERGTKEDERIGWSWDMIFRFMTWTTGSSGGGGNKAESDGISTIGGGSL
jgi:hypothetical protein